jgi:hypothetical protein
MVIIRKFFVIIALCIFQNAYAVTYYIDSERGNDSWSGKLPVKAGGTSIDGPWQSLNRLANATLSPGDVVELQCASKWIQTLRLKNSGTSDFPIVIRPTSSTCATPPSIDGSQGVDEYAWISSNNIVYKATWPIQKFQNGSLAAGIEGWTSWSAIRDQKLTYENNCPDSSNSCGAFKSSSDPNGSIVISNDFMVEGGISYNGELSLRIPTGVKVKVLVRRGSSPYEPISSVQWIIGTNTWRKISFAFTSPYAVSNARLDIEVPYAGAQIYFKNASLKPNFAAPIGAWMGDLPLLPAHHPNRGHDATRLSSVYAKVAADSNSVPNNYGSNGSTYLDIDSTLKLPPGVALQPGNRLRIRSNPWHIDEVTITQIMGTRLYFEPATRHPILAGQAYFVLGELGMLDSPGEWFYDTSTEATYIWTPDTKAPSSQIRVGILEKGIDLSGRSNITIEGITIRHTGLGIDLTKAQNINVNSVNIEKTINEGVLANYSRNISIITSRLYRTGRDAISASTAGALVAKDNDIIESAVAMEADLTWSLPVPTFAAIWAGTSANITGNRINHSASNGIWALSNGIIENNAVRDSCLQTNDCAGIYVNYASPNTRIVSNLIEQVTGNLDGLSENTRTHAIGLYLDDLATDMQVKDNSVAWADYGIQVHNAHNNIIAGNLLYGNRNSQLWFLERTNKTAASGDVYNNTVSENRFFPSAAVASVIIESEIDSLINFGKLSTNFYSGLFGPRVVNESWPNHNLAYTLPEWQNTSNSDRHESQDAASSELLQNGYAAYLAESSNIVPNGNLAMGMQGWTSWNPSEPFSTRALEACTIGPCVRMTGGGGTTLLSTPNFSVRSGVSYRVTFDAKTGIDGQFIAPVVRRGGPGSLFERLMPVAEGFTGSTGWRRYTFSFVAAKTVNAGDPITGDLGARLDFEKIALGQILWIANVEIVPLVPVENTLRTQLLTNAGRTTQSIECPDLESSPEYCSRYHVFPEGTPVSWPVDVPPLGAVPIYTINQATRDIDGDGIADSQDQCPSTAKNYQVNAAGCALTQIPGQQ